MNMQPTHLLVLLMLVLFSCTASQKQTGSDQSAELAPDYGVSLLNDTTFLLTEVSKVKTYGYSENNPVKVGGNDKREGPRNERRFLNALTGPNGEAISYERIGSCCQFKTPNGFMGSGLLNQYEVRWEGQQQPIVLYTNMYEYDSLKVPMGLKPRQ